MRFEFCGNIDCPEWVLAEISLINKMSTVKLKLILSQIIKKITHQPYDQEKLSKLLRDQKLDVEEQRCFLSIMEFIIEQAAKHDIADNNLNKDML